MRFAVATILFAALPAVAIAGYTAGRIAADDGPAKLSTANIFHFAQEFRTGSQTTMPLPSAVENVVVYTVPPGKSVRIQSLALPLGISARAKSDGQERTPLGLGVMSDANTCLPVTVRFSSSPWELVHLTPGVVLPPGARICLRFDEPVKALSGSLYLNGTLE